MVLGSPLPTWKQILTCHRKRSRKTFFEEQNAETLFLAQSCMSIALILNAIKEIEKKTVVKMMLPDFFCNETIASFQQDWVELDFYPVKDDLDPDWDDIKEWTKENEFDVFLFTHYFGKYLSNISRAKELCKNHAAILIEDCAHVLYPTGKMGASGDFVIYSPHKQLPIMDGGVLVCHESEHKPVVAELFQWMKDQYLNFPIKRGVSKWLLKKAIQKVVPIQRRSTYYAGIHYGSGREKPCKIERMSEESYRILCDYEYVDLKKAANLRRDNLEMMNAIIHQMYPEVIPLISRDVDVPYFAVYSLKKTHNKEKTAKQMIADGFTVLYWPDLPCQMNGLEGHEDMKQLSENIIVIPIHQDLNPQALARAYMNSSYEKIKNNAINIEWLSNDNQSRKRYNGIIKQIEFSNIPQEWDYGDVKKKTENSGLLRGIIRYENTKVGVIQVLTKKRCGIPIAARVNRGPLLIKGYDKTEIHIQVLRKVRSRIPHPIPMIVAPNMEHTPLSVICLSQEKWRRWGLFGYETGVIDLSKSLDDIRKELDSKWRNQLKASEKANLTIQKGYDRFDEIVMIYESSQKEKGYQGVPKAVLYGLKDVSSHPLEVFYITNNEGQLIAFDIFYLTENFGLYFVGWNDDEGRKMYVNNLLLFHAVRFFKEKGTRWLDLGGIDYIDTEENARFKDGMKPRHIRLVGEFVKF